VSIARRAAGQQRHDGLPAPTWLQDATKRKRGGRAFAAVCESVRVETKERLDQSSVHPPGLRRSANRRVIEYGNTIWLCCCYSVARRRRVRLDGIFGRPQRSRSTSGYRSTCCACGVAGDAYAHVAAFASAPCGRGLAVDPERPDLVKLLGAHTCGRDKGGMALDFRPAESQDSPPTTAQCGEPEATVSVLAELTGGSFPIGQVAASAKRVGHWRRDCADTGAWQGAAADDTIQ
jgi:hypothetical protein